MLDMIKKYNIKEKLEISNFSLYDVNSLNELECIVLLDGNEIVGYVIHNHNKYKAYKKPKYNEHFSEFIDSNAQLITLFMKKQCQ